MDAVLKQAAYNVFMKGSQQKTLNLEVGVMCNNRCVFCFQKGYRGLAGFEKVVPLSEIEQKLAWGRTNGFNEVTFTGGEPTIRPDFLQLVALAKANGYERVAVTTNGWKLGIADFFSAAIKAGLSSIGVSIHGPSSEVHDLATGHKGSFAHAIRAIRNAVAARTVRLNTFTVVSRINRGRLVELADLLFALGVRLMVLQPTILSKSNVEEAGTVALDLPELVEEVRRVTKRAIKRGFKVKLFNLPPCLFTDVLPGLEVHHYRQVTFRQDNVIDPRSEHPMEAEGHVRFDACAACCLKVMCPGLDITLMPQEDLVAHFEQAIAEFYGRELWLAGTDLLEPIGLERVIYSAKSRGIERVVVTQGGSSRAGTKVVEAILRANGSEIVLVHHAKDPYSADRIVRHDGNDRYLLRLCEALRQYSERPEVSLLLDERGIEFLAVQGVLDVIDRVRLAHDVSNIRGGLLERIAGLCKDKQLVIHTFGTSPDTHFLPEGVLFDTSPMLLPVAILSKQFTVLNWSVPPRVDGWIRGLKPRPIVPRYIHVEPITRKMLLNENERRCCGPRVR